MTTLDCFSVDTTVSSFAKILRVTDADLRHRLLSIHDDERFRKRRSESTHEEALLSEVVGSTTDTSVLFPSEVIWFHATRVPASTPFEQEGLLPLKECLPRLRQVVATISKELGVVRRGTPSYSYASKIESLSIQGPEAFLLRDAALGRGTRHRNFLRAPEIVEDLAIAHGGDQAELIIERYRKETKSCIVVFRSRSVHKAVVGSALAYCHASLHQDGDPTHWNTCFSGNGEAVPSSDIERIEWIDD